MVTLLVSPNLKIYWVDETQEFVLVIPGGAIRMTRDFAVAMRNAMASKIGYI